ncbi:MAG: ThiF family adenylyltransferase [Phycisphaeraceae bacterium]
MTVVTVFENHVQKASAATSPVNVRFHCWDDASVFTAVTDTGRAAATGTVAGVIMRTSLTTPPPRCGDEQVCVLLPEPQADDDEGGITGRAFIWLDGRWASSTLDVVSLEDSLAERRSSLLETQQLQDARVLIIGTGSMFSPVIIALAQSGVGRFVVMDHDRIEAGNVVRHIAGAKDVGRLKVDVMRDAIRDTNPLAEVDTWARRASPDSEPLLRELIGSCDLTLVGVDDDAARSLINRIGVESGKPMIFGGAFRRAYGGQVLRVRPGEGGPCFQCFLQQLPEHARDREIASATSGAAHAYSDRPVVIEPGLSIDIAPMSHMIAKLALQELMAGKSPSFERLAEDLSMPLMLWLNRREPKTPYEQLEPLGCNVDGLRVLRWLGLDLPRHPGCPVCGDFLGEMTKAHGLSRKQIQQRAAELAAESGDRTPTP